MDLVLYSQYYRTRTPERQLEIDECLRRNLNHPGISRVVLFCESDAPPVPQGTVPVEVVTSDERITYAEWFRWVKRQGSGIGLLLNADIYLDEGLEHLAASFDTPEAFLALTRYNPGHAGFHLNDYPHWAQDVWGVRSDSELSQSLLYASSFPLGFPGCDNRIAYVMWSHGFRVRNPCYHVRSVHLQASEARGYDKTSDRLYGGVSYVHPSLAPDEDAELEFTLWTRSEQRPAGVVINQLAIEQGLHQLRHSEEEVAQRFLDLQEFTVLNWLHDALGSAHLQGELHPFASEDTVFLPITSLLGDGVEIWLKRPIQLEGLMIRLPRRASAGQQLALQAEGQSESRIELSGDAALTLRGGGQRCFWQPPELKGTAWCRLQLKLIGDPALPQPAWCPEEGAELVLFGKAGSLSEEKSSNVIAEPAEPESSDLSTTETAPAELATQPLRTVKFADTEFLRYKNLTIDRSGILGPDGVSVADVFAGADSEPSAKFAFNQFNTTKSGAYTATVVIKAGSQSAIVLRINDQTGMNDARQTFDLANGMKVGPAINSGSVTEADSAIEPMGDGWYRCSIAGVFEEPLTFLQAPSVWFEHYAPSASVGTLYTSDACLFAGLCIPSSLPLSFDAGDDQSFSGSDATPAFGWGPFSMISRQEFNADGCALVKRFSSRFAVFTDGAVLYFVDHFWPMVGTVAFQGSAQEALENGEEQLFAVGFLQPLQERKPDQITSLKLHKNQLLFWKYPCRTEEDAHQVHSELSGPHREGDIYYVYIGLPWATFIDRDLNQLPSGSPYPDALLLAHSNRNQALAAVLSRWGRSLQVHSVCQHIFWRDAAFWIRSAGITDLWLSHKEKGLDEAQGMRLHSWTLYAVNDRDPERRQGLAFLPIEHRRVFASFRGAFMPHYISDVRQRMAALADLKGYQITINDSCHFNNLVYNFQVHCDESKQYAIDSDEVCDYNELLSHSRFSLCPVGAGPNTLRLWESLAVGSIPVLLSDRHQLPDIERLLPGAGLSWSEVIVLHPEAELDQLDERLRAIDTADLHRRHLLCRSIYEASLSMTCFGRSTRQGRPIPLLQERFKPQQVHVLGKTPEQFTGMMQLVPALLSLDPYQASSLMVYFDQTEQLIGFHLTAEGCSLDQIKVSISSYLSHNEFEDLSLRIEVSSPSCGSFWLPQGGLWWAIGIKLTAEWLPGVDAQPSAHLQLAVLSEKDAFARGVRRLDRAGILKAASNCNPKRLDNVFDTNNIESGSIIQKLQEFARSELVIDGDELYPAVWSPSTNLIDEPLSDGIAMYVHLMNRNENVRKNLPNWLGQRFDELILLDWSSKEPVAEIPGVFEDPRVRVVRVDGQTQFIRTLAQNLASRMARRQRIFKCDSDVEFRGDFFSAHPLQPGEFWVGEWHHARNMNERHLHGETYYFIQDFERVNGYDERILSYGYDDSNLKDRMVLAGLRKKVINYDFLHHQKHGDDLRASNQSMIHPMVRIVAHRLFVNSQPLFSRSSPCAAYECQSHAPSLVKFAAPDFAKSKFDYGAAFEEQALEEVAGWYSDQDTAKLTREQKIDLVWANSEAFL